MKPFFTILMIFSFFVSLSQVKQSLPTGSLPAISGCRITEFSGALTQSVGSKIQFSFATDFISEGTVQKNMFTSADMQTMIIELSDPGKSLFQLSKRTNADGSFVYVGHVINSAQGCFYELSRSKNGDYLFIKKELKNVLPVCEMHP